MTTSSKKIINKFWSYDLCQPVDFKQETIDGYKQKGRFYDDSAYLFELLSVTPHPSFKASFGKDSIEPNILSFVNVRVDINSLKILFALLPNTKIVTLKFSSNLLEFQNLEFLLTSLMTKANNIYNFIFEWNYELMHNSKIISAMSANQLSDSELEIIDKSRNLLAKITSHSKLDALCLRGNYMGDKAAAILFSNLKANTSLQILNLYKNNLTSECTQFIVEALNENRKLEEVNLGGNFFTDGDFKQIICLFGKFVLSEEEVETHFKLVKERDEILDKNKKLKNQRKNELPVPKVDEVEEYEGTHYLVKNTKIRSLNFMQNKLSEAILEEIFNFLNVSEEVLLVLDMKIFNKEDRERLADPRNKFTSKVYLAK